MSLRHYDDDETRMNASRRMNTSRGQSCTGTWRISPKNYWIFGVNALDQRDCFRMVQAAEARNGHKYSFVIKMRTDQQICSPWPPHHRFNWSWYEATKTVATWSRSNGRRVIHDHVAIMPRSLADTFFLRASALWECDDYREVVRYCNGPALYPECYLSHYLKSHDLNFDNGLTMGREQMCLWKNSTLRGRCNHCELTHQTHLSDSSAIIPQMT